MAKIEFISEFSSVDIDAQKLANELGLREHRLSSEHDAQVVTMLRDVKSLVADWGELPYIALGPILKRDEEKIFKIFESCPVSWRLPLHITSDMFFEITEGSEHGELAFRNIISCWKWYAYVSSQKNDIAFYEGKENGVYAARDRAQEEIQRMMRGSWGRRHKAWMGMIGEKKLVEEFDVRMKSAIEVFFKKARFIPSLEALQDEMNRLFSSSDVFFEKLFIDNEVSDKNPAIDIPPLNFLLCQNHIACYNELLRNTTRVADGGISDHMPAWREWIKKYFEILMKNDSEVKKGFYYAFSLQGGLFENGKIPKRLRRKKPESTDGIPEELCGLLESLYIPYREKQRELRKATRVVEKIPTPRPHQTAMAALVSRPLESIKTIVPSPDIKTIFLDLEEAKKNKTQLTQIDFSQCHFPEGTTIQVERSLPPAKKPSFEPLNNIDIRGLNMIPVVLGRDIQGHFIYRITITLPSTHRFENRNTLEVIYYAKAEPTPAEIEAEKIQQDALRNQPKSVPAPVAPVVEKVAKKVEKIIDPAEISLIAAAFVLETHLQKYGNNDMYEGGPIEIVISDADASEVLGEEVKNLLPLHRTWIIQEDNTISPSTDDADIHNHLTTIADSRRTKAQTKIEKQQEQEKQTREQAEYEQERLKFTPMLEFARGFQFDGKQNGHFDDQKNVLREILRELGWSLPVAFGVGQVIWRHIGAKVRILYTSKQCISFVVNGEQSELTGAQKKCYEEVAQAFAHIARFFNVEAKERTRMVNKERAIRKETETGAVAYDKLLQEGRARLVLFGPYQGGHGVWSSKFPTEKNPFMLDERASHSTIESLLQQYPHAELCYRRDQLCINGEIAQDASQESIENVSLNITELRQSPRARYILKKRILITLKLEKFSDETDRAPIKHEKNKKEGAISALDILLRIQEERSVQSVSDVTEDFLNYYIDELERNRIRVHYVWPLSSRLDEHQARMRKHAAKIASSKTETTAD